MGISTDIPRTSALDGEKSPADILRLLSAGVIVGHHMEYLAKEYLPFPAPSGLALGMFDGLHLGHRDVILSAVNSGFYPILITFRQHPRGDDIPYLLTKAQRDRELSALGIKGILELNFNEIRDISPEKFFLFLKNQLNMAFASCGYNYHFGRGGGGNAGVLRELCESGNIGCAVAPPVTLNGEEISSTGIRHAISRGNVEGAAAMLGRDFSYDFTVLRGDERGRTLGFPTINQRFDSGFIIPKFGVYAGEALVDGRIYKSVTNIGLRPTFPLDAPISETHIMGFDGDLYGRNIEVRIKKYIRDERKFDSPEDLIRQLDSDRAIADS